MAACSKGGCIPAEPLLADVQSQALLTFNDMYCPNCNAEVAHGSLACTGCGADFGPHSNWRPGFVRHLRNGSEPRRKPELAHAWRSILIFVAIGPIFGLLAITIASDTRGSLSLVLHPFAIIGAFGIGGLPALFAGSLYCLAALLVCALAPRVTIGPLWAGLLGGFAGYLGVILFAMLFFAGTTNYAARFAELLLPGGVAGAGAGLISGWRLPVGRASRPQA